MKKTAAKVKTRMQRTNFKNINKKWEVAHTKSFKTTKRSIFNAQCLKQKKQNMV